MTGTVKFFLPKRIQPDGKNRGDFGFVEVEGPRPGTTLEWFFHAMDIVGGAALQKGDEITFILDDDRKRGGLRAVNIRALAREYR